MPGQSTRDLPPFVKVPDAEGELPAVRTCQIAEVICAIRGHDFFVQYCSIRPLLIFGPAE